MGDAYAYSIQYAQRNHKVLERIDPEGERQIHDMETGAACFRGVPRACNL